MTFVHPDPDKLRRLAEDWRDQADRLERLGYAVVNGVWTTTWKGGAALAGLDAATTVDIQLKQVAEGARRWAHQLDQSADQWQERIDAYEESMILGIILGIFSVVLMPLFIFLPIRIGLMVANVIKTLGLTGTTARAAAVIANFGVNALAFGTIQLAMDMIAEPAAHAYATGSPNFTPSWMEGVFVGVAALLGGLFAIGPGLATLERTGVTGGASEAEKFDVPSVDVTSSGEGQNNLGGAGRNGEGVNEGTTSATVPARNPATDVDRMPTPTATPRSLPARSPGSPPAHADATTVRGLPSPGRTNGTASTPDLRAGAGPRELPQLRVHTTINSPSAGRAAPPAVHETPSARVGEPAPRPMTSDADGVRAPSPRVAEHTGAPRAGDVSPRTPSVSSVHEGAINRPGDLSPHAGEAAPSAPRGVRGPAVPAPGHPDGVPRVHGDEMTVPGRPPSVPGHLLKPATPAAHPPPTGDAAPRITPRPETGGGAPHGHSGPAITDAITGRLAHIDEGMRIRHAELQNTHSGPDIPEAAEAARAIRKGAKTDFGTMPERAHTGPMHRDPVTFADHARNLLHRFAGFYAGEAGVRDKMGDIRSFIDGKHWGMVPGDMAGARRGTAEFIARLAGMPEEHVATVTAGLARTERGAVAESLSDFREGLRTYRGGGVPGEAPHAGGGLARTVAEGRALHGYDAATAARRAAEAEVARSDAPAATAAEIRALKAEQSRAAAAADRWATQREKLFAKLSDGMTEFHRVEQRVRPVMDSEPPASAMRHGQPVSREAIEQETATVAHRLRPNVVADFAAERRNAANLAGLSSGRGSGPVVRSLESVPPPEQTAMLHDFRASEQQIFDETLGTVTRAGFDAHSARFQQAAWQFKVRYAALRESVRVNGVMHHELGGLTGAQQRLAEDAGRHLSDSDFSSAVQQWRRDFTGDVTRMVGDAVRRGKPFTAKQQHQWQEMRQRWNDVELPRYLREARVPEQRSAPDVSTRAPLADVDLPRLPAELARARIRAAIETAGMPVTERHGMLFVHANADQVAMDRGLVDDLADAVSRVGARSGDSHLVLGPGVEPEWALGAGLRAELRPGVKVHAPFLTTSERLTLADRYPEVVPHRPTADVATLPGSEPDSDAASPFDADAGDGAAPGAHDVRVFRVQIQPPTADMDRLAQALLRSKASWRGGEPASDAKTSWEAAARLHPRETAEASGPDTAAEVAGSRDGHVDTPPSYEQMLDGDKLPSYQQARTDPPPAPTRSDVARWMAENDARRNLIVPKPLDEPLSGLNRTIDEIRSEQRAAASDQVGGLSRAERPVSQKLDPGRLDGAVPDDPGVPSAAMPDARQTAWNALNKYEADLRQTLGDGIRQGEAPGDFASGTPAPGRSGPTVAAGLLRSADSTTSPASAGPEVREQVRELPNVELDRAHSWLRRQSDPSWAGVRDHVAGEWQDRVDRGDLEPGVSTISAHEAARRLLTPRHVEQPPPAPRDLPEPLPPAEQFRGGHPHERTVWSHVRQNLIDELRKRLGNARTLDEMLPDTDGDFVRALHDTPGGSGITEPQLDARLNDFRAEVSRSFADVLSDSFAHVRAPSAAERDRWHRRYADLVRNLDDDLRMQVGHNEIDAAASRAFDRWREQDVEPVATYNAALQHWTRDATGHLETIGAAHRWQDAAAVLARRIREADVYLAMHRGAERAAAEVADMFDEVVAARPAPFADLDRVARSRAEAMSAAHDQYLSWWRPTRIAQAVDDPTAQAHLADDRFPDLGAAVRVRLDHLDRTQPLLDWMERMTQPDTLPPALRSALDEERLATVTQHVRREAEVVIDAVAPSFGSDPQPLTENVLHGLRHSLNLLRDQIPERAAFATGAAELARSALERVNTEAMEGVIEALTLGLDPSASLTTASADARRAVLSGVERVRTDFAAQAYTPTALAGHLAELESRLSSVVARVRAETVRDALLRHGDAAAVATLNEHAAAAGRDLGTPVQQRLYSDFERDYVAEYHQMFGGDGGFDVEAWLRRTRPEPAAPSESADDRIETRLLTGPDGDVADDEERRAAELMDVLGGLTVPGARPDPVAGEALLLRFLPEPERHAWQQRAQADPAGDAPDDLLNRVAEVAALRLGNDTALADLVSGATQAWAAAGSGRVTPEHFERLLRRFIGDAGDLGPRVAEPEEQLGELATLDVPDVEPSPAPHATVVATPPEATGEQLRQLTWLSPPSGEPGHEQESDARLLHRFAALFKARAEALPAKVGAEFWSRWLAAGNDPDRQAAIRGEMTAAADAERAKMPIASRYPQLHASVATEFTKRVENADSLAEMRRIEVETADAAARAAARGDDGASSPAGTTEPVDEFDRQYAVVPDAERALFRRDIRLAGTPEALERLYDQLDSRRDALQAAADAPGVTFEQQIEALGRFVPRYGYRVIGEHAPPITRELAARFDHDAAELDSLDDLDAFDERLRRDGYARARRPGDDAQIAARLSALPTVPMQHDDLVGMFRRWARQEATRAGLEKAAWRGTVTAVDEALAAGDGTALYEAVTGLQETVLATRRAALTPADEQPVTPHSQQPHPSAADLDVEHELAELRAAVRLVERSEAAPEIARVRERLSQAPAAPDTDPVPPVRPRTLDDLRRQMPSVPSGAPRDPDRGSGPDTPGPQDGEQDLGDFAEEIRRMAAAEGATGRSLGVAPDEQLTRRLRRLGETETDELPAPTPKPPGTAPDPAPTTTSAAGPSRPDIESIQPDGSVVVARAAAHNRTASPSERLRERMAEEAAAEVSDAYDSYLALERDLRANREDLASRVRAAVDAWRAEHPSRHAQLSDQMVERIERDLADTITPHFYTVRDTLTDGAMQRTLMAGLIAEKTQGLAGRLDEAISRADTGQTAPAIPSDRLHARVDDLTDEHFDKVVGAFRRRDLFGGRWLSADDYARLRAGFAATGRDAAGPAGAAADWSATPSWVARMDAAAARLADELAVTASGNRWFERTVAAVAFDGGDDPSQAPQIPQAEWYRTAFGQRLRDDYLRAGAGTAPGWFGSLAAYAESMTTAVSVATQSHEDSTWSNWHASFDASLTWLRDQLTFAYEMRDVLSAAAAQFHRHVAHEGGAGATATVVALAEGFRVDAVRSHLRGKGLPPDALAAWLEREKADTHVFAAEWARRSAASTRSVTDFAARADRITGALLTEYAPRVTAAAEVARRQPDFAGLFAAEVGRAATRTTELAAAYHDRSAAHQWIRTLDGLDPDERVAWRDRAVSELTDLYQQVWHAVIRTGSAVDSEPWRAAVERWEQLNTRYWAEARIAAARRQQTARIQPMIARLRAEAADLGLSDADIAAAVAVFTREATAALEALLHSKPFDPARLGRWAELDAELAAMVPQHLRMARARREAMKGAADDLQNRLAQVALSADERRARSAEAMTATADVFDLAYRQFRHVDDDQRVEQAEFAAARQRQRVVTDAPQRPASEPAASDQQPFLGDLAADAHRRVADGALDAGPGVLHRIHGEVDGVLEDARRRLEAGEYAAGSAERVLATARNRLDEIVTGIPDRLAAERRLETALATAADRFATLPGAESLPHEDPLRHRFLNEVAGKAAVGDAHLTSAAWTAAAAGALRSTARARARIAFEAQLTRIVDAEVDRFAGADAVTARHAATAWHHDALRRFESHLTTAEHVPAVGDTSLAASWLADHRNGVPDLRIWLLQRVGWRAAEAQLDGDLDAAVSVLRHQVPAAALDEALRDLRSRIRHWYFRPGLSIEEVTSWPRTYAQVAAQMLPRLAEQASRPDMGTAVAASPADHAAHRTTGAALSAGDAWQILTEAQVADRSRSLLDRSGTGERGLMLLDLAYRLDRPAVSALQRLTDDTDRNAAALLTIVDALLAHAAGEASALRALSKSVFRQVERSNRQPLADYVTAHHLATAPAGGRGALMDVITRIYEC
ncbi:hypothetical protein [Mangrovihabitans endophyticus]|uniref:Uncharacterized protein n=1 Tax=Mangrovihabitans endophyticus TaxID=1751298 RepID=A0A8J3BUL2_9ACTN|nr:hypothetical protein [Mangrovihabitans endophyticus]GGK78752.1 hypothetical protein GCM10012284_10820 [Mangrovihabitans endophyticus]